MAVPNPNAGAQNDSSGGWGQGLGVGDFGASFTIDTNNPVVSGITVTVHLIP